jgi:propanol-preferring alcohol dehydrogenase
MKAMILEQPGTPLKPVQLPDPEPGPQQVQVAISACGVCRTDLHVVDGELTEPKLPIIPGHEIVGTVTALGAGVDDFNIGERIGIPWLGHTCGCCSYCKSGAENLCDDPGFTGYQIDGGYADMSVADARYCFPLQGEFSDAEAAPLLCAGLIGYRCLVMSGDDSRRLGIYGFGAAAHIIAQVAAGDSTTAPPCELDAAIIFAPVGALVPAALRAVRKGGIVVCGGIHMSDIPSFPYDILWGERVVRSVANLTRQDAIDFLALAPKIPVQTHIEEYPLEQANEALHALRSGSLSGAAVLLP